jgi:multiple sugar transport system permease protein
MATQAHQDKQIRARSGRQRSIWRKLWGHPETRVALALVAPTLIAVVGLFLYPLGLTLVFSFGRVDLASFSVAEFVGFNNYMRIIRDPAFQAIALRTVYFGAIISLATTVVAFFFSLLLNQAFWGRSIVRVAVIVPWAVPSVVAGILWGQMFNAQHGFINGLIRALGGEGGIIWLGEPVLALHAIIIAETWRGLPLATLVLLAGLQMLPSSVYEAADVDGATAWQKFRHVTLPLMWPLLLPLLILQFVFAMKSFDIIFVLTGGGPRMGTTTLNYYVYQRGLEAFRFGDAAAAAYILTLLMLLVIGALAFVRWRQGLREGEAPNDS